MVDVIIDIVENARIRTIDRLQEQGFFELTPRDNTLTNEIHKTFHRDRFENITDEAYQNMKPALQLASYFVQHPEVLRYFTPRCLAKKMLPLTCYPSTGPGFHMLAINSNCSDEMNF